MRHILLILIVMLLCMDILALLSLSTLYMWHLLHVSLGVFLLIRSNGLRIEGITCCPLRQMWCDRWFWAIWLKFTRHDLTIHYAEGWQTQRKIWITEWKNTTNACASSHSGSLSHLMSMTMNISMALNSHQISAQLNPCGRFRSNMWVSTLHHNHQNAKWGNISWKNGVYPSIRATCVPEEQTREKRSINTKDGISVSWSHQSKRHTQTCKCTYGHKHTDMCMHKFAQKQQKRCFHTDVPLTPVYTVLTWNLCVKMHRMHSEFVLFQSCCWAQLPSCPCPIQGHCYCPLAKSVRPSLTQIRFLSKWDFYCSKGAGSRISLSQPFPVSSQRGSAALLQFFFSLPASSLGQIWNTDCRALLVSAKSWFQRMKRVP